MTNLENEFPLDPQMAYLNHAAVAPWPRRASEAVARFAQENITNGARYYPRWLAVENQLRRNLQRLMGAGDPGDIALVKNTSEALSFVAFGLEWKAGDEVIISAEEFPSNRVVWEALHRYGVTVKEVVISGVEDPEAQLIEAMTDKTRLLSISSVQYGSGLRLELARLGAHCRKNNVLFCVDAIQSVGACQMNVEEMQIDFAMADGHKWLLGPEGLGALYVRPDLRSQLTLHEYGWHMLKNRGNYDVRDTEPADDATRFECGSPNILAAHALEASTSLLLLVGMDVVERRLGENLSFLEAGLSKLPGVELITASDRQRRLGILTFKVKGGDPKALHKALMDEGVVCASRGGGVRLSPHFYTPESTLTLALDKIGALIKRLSATQ